MLTSFINKSIDGRFLGKELDGHVSYPELGRSIPKVFSESGLRCRHLIVQLSERINGGTGYFT
jgi:hypothetical protein